MPTFLSFFGTNILPTSFWPLLFWAPFLYLKYISILILFLIGKVTTGFSSHLQTFKTVHEKNCCHSFRSIPRSQILACYQNYTKATQKTLENFQRLNLFLMQIMQLKSFCDFCPPRSRINQYLLKRVPNIFLVKKFTFTLKYKVKNIKKNIWQGKVR